MNDNDNEDEIEDQWHCPYCDKRLNEYLICSECNLHQTLVREDEIE
jgi:rubredoxin